MGLDMYLYGVKQEFWKHDYNIGGYKESTEIGYWRKANQIHAWFVEYCQDGIDNCATYYVSGEDLECLLNKCKKVIANPERAKEILPTDISGCFFGSDEYDEYYFADIRETIEICEWALAQDFDYFEYHSSW